MARVQFAGGSSKLRKRDAGRASLERIPVVIRSPETIGAGFEQRIRSQLARRVGYAAGLIERITVRFDDVNGTKGGVDIVCRIKVVATRRPSIVVEKRAESHRAAFAQALDAVATAVERTQKKHNLSTGRSRAPIDDSGVRKARGRDAAARDPGELIGRRVGRGPIALARALARPEKHDRAAYVDTSAVGVSASDRRAGGNATARRNTLARTTRATATLEDSRTRPSRKSTRKSANRGKPSQTKERAAMTRLQTPASRARRGG